MQVYDNSLKCEDRSFITRFKKILTIGNGSAVLYLTAVLLDYLILLLLTVIQPKAQIKKEKEFDHKRYTEVIQELSPK